MDTLTTLTWDFLRANWLELLVVLSGGTGLCLGVLHLINAHRARMSRREYIRWRTGRWPD